MELPSLQDAIASDSRASPTGSATHHRTLLDWTTYPLAAEHAFPSSASVENLGLARATSLARVIWRWGRWCGRS